MQETLTENVDNRQRHDLFQTKNIGEMELCVLIYYWINVKPYVYLLIYVFVSLTILPVCDWLNFPWTVCLAEALRERKGEKVLLHLNFLKRKRHRSSLVEGGRGQTTVWNGGIEMAESLGDDNALRAHKIEQFRSFLHATSWSNFLFSR
jgi:hypothetical protein